MGNICDIFSNRKKKSHEIKNSPKIIENRHKIEFSSFDDIVIVPSPIKIPVKIIYNEEDEENHSLPREYLANKYKYTFRRIDDDVDVERYI